MAADTTAEAQSVQRAVWARLGPEGRAQAAIELSEATRRIALSGLAERHPELTAPEVVRLFVTRVHGIDLDHRAR